MSSNDQDSTEYQEDEAFIASLYEDLPEEKPSEFLDKRILAAANKAVETQAHEKTANKKRSRYWVQLSSAASLLLVITVSFYQVSDMQSPLEQADYIPDTTSEILLDYPAVKTAPAEAQDALVQEVYEEEKREQEQQKKSRTSEEVSRMKKEQAESEVAIQAGELDVYAGSEFQQDELMLKSEPAPAAEPIPVVEVMPEIMADEIESAPPMKRQQAEAEAGIAVELAAEEVAVVMADDFIMAESSAGAASSSDSSFAVEELAQDGVLFLDAALLISFQSEDAVWFLLEETESFYLLLVESDNLTDPQQYIAWKHEFALPQEQGETLNQGDFDVIKQVQLRLEEAQ